MDSPSAGHQFLFQRRNEKIDWRKLASVDVNRIAREIDVDAIQDNIVSVTYCNIEHELGYNELDPNFVKLYRLAQLTIEYLLHCQDYLQQSLEEKNLTIKQLNDKVGQILSDQEKLQNDVNNRNTAYKNLKKEFQKSKKLIAEYQMMIRAGANGLHKCVCCEKSFVTESFLRGHMERRHPEEARKMYASKYSPTNQSIRDVDMMNQLNEIKTRLRTTEEQLNKERENLSLVNQQEREKTDETLLNLRQQNESWRFNEHAKMKDEMEKYKEMMMSELKQTQKEKEKLQQDIIDLQQSIGGKKRSNLGDLVDDETNIPYKEIFAKMQGMEADLKGQIKSMQEQHQKEETAHKIVFNKKLSQEKDKNDRLEKERQKDKQFYEQQIEALKKKLLEHDTLIEKNKASLEADRVDGNPELKEPPRTPPAPPVRPAEESFVEKELPEKDSVTLWVSVNRKLSQPSYRVFRSPTSIKGDWQDLFTFNALLEPIGDFQKPIYVYSCPGSPYWRQYVSSSAFPPKQNYKLDMTFYVTTTKLLGTIKLNVFDAGSGTVVRSMLSRDDAIPDWRQKGLSFYVLKTGPTKTSLTRSGTFNSDIFEGVSDDDVSVSSFTGTEVAKQDLADDIQRSRENLVEKFENEEETQGELKAEDLEENESEDDEDEDEESVEDNIDGVKVEDEFQGTQESHFGTSSSSFLNTTLPAKGEFYPYEGNPLAVARFNHSKEMLDGQRKEVLEILEDHMEKRGVDPDETRLSNQTFKNKLKHHTKEKEMKEKTFLGFTHYREKINNAIDEFSAREWAKKKGKKAGRKLKAAAEAIKGAVTLKRSPQREVVMSSSWQTSSGESREEYTKDLEEVSSTENERVLIRYQRGTESGGEESLVEKEGDDDEEEDEEEEEEISEPWDSNEEEEEEIDDTEDNDQIDGRRNQQYYQPEEPYRPKMRSPKGEKVKELTKSLEASLTLRGSVKKPVGAIDLHDTGEDAKYAKPKRSVSFRDHNQYHGNEEDEDEDSDFSITSFDASKNSSGTNLGTNHTVEDIDDMFGSYPPPHGKKPPHPTSSTPYTSASRHSSSASAQRQPSKQQTAVTKFTLEDFDDDDDESF